MIRARGIELPGFVGFVIEQAIVGLAFAEEMSGPDLLWSSSRLGFRVGSCSANLAQHEQHVFLASQRSEQRCVGQRLKLLGSHAEPLHDSVSGPKSLDAPVFA